ncbi:hypothetical protein FRC09_016419 [Ceratobasidium sp. 395]|nr:hypothetical protein FRC09_016419 [Ceratobasidium sp. 395]
MASSDHSMSDIRVRDPEYYFEDGSTIFLVENTLFKIHRSLLTPRSEVFGSMFALPNQPNAATPTFFTIEGLCDDIPIVIPGVRAIHFRYLLLYFYGTMADSAYRSLVLDATNESEHSPETFVKYLHIASLAHRFCFSSVEVWALDQLKKVLRSYETLATNHWADDNDLLDALAYSKLLADREVEHNVRNLIRYYSHALHADSDLDEPYKDDPNRLAQLYKRPLLKEQDPALFGYVFCVVLAAEHNTALWKCLDRDERSQLFAALVHLTPLPLTLPIGWINDTSEISAAVDAQLRRECFNDCAQSLLVDFGEAFADSNFMSNSIRAGIAELLELAEQRQIFEQKVRTSRCACAKQLLGVMDLKIDNLFTEIAGKYHNCLA